MERVAFFVDLPNFYSSLLKSGLGEPRLLRDYFIHWLDFDLLASSLAPQSLGIWVFYSGERIGPSNERIENLYLRNYVDRINALAGVTARDVNIPGEQREHVTIKCESCGTEQSAEWRSEKGIDASLTVHLFDTIDSWDSAYLLSGDADFVPVVASLRRRGKIVSGAGFTSPSSALVRECYSYIDLGSHDYVAQDILAFQIFREGGILNSWLCHKVESISDRDHSTVQFGGDWFLSGSSSDNRSCHMVLYTEGPASLDSRLESLGELRNWSEEVYAYNKARHHYRIMVGESAWPGVERRLDSYRTRLRYLEGLEVHRLAAQANFKASYEFDPAAKPSVLT